MNKFKVIKDGPMVIPFEIRVKENSYPIKISQLYGFFRDDGELEMRVNGSITVTDGPCKTGQTCKVHATVCNSEGQILYILDDYHKVPMIKGEYHAFSMFCYKVERFLAKEDMAYVEIFITVENKEKRNSMEIFEDDEL